MAKPSASRRLPEPPAASGDLRLIGPNVGQGSAPPADQGALLQQFGDINKLRIQQLVAEVNHDLDVSRARVATDPAGVKQQLRLVLDQVVTTPELPADTRAQCEIVSKRSFCKRPAGRRSTTSCRRSNSAGKLKPTRISIIQEGIGRTQEKVKQLTERVNSLLAEGRYAEAQDDAAAEIARVAPASNPVNTIAVSTHDNSLFFAYDALNTINRQTIKRSIWRRCTWSINRPFPSPTISRSSIRRPTCGES